MYAWSRLRPFRRLGADRDIAQADPALSFAHIHGPQVSPGKRSSRRPYLITASLVHSWNGDEPPPEKVAQADDWVIDSTVYAPPSKLEPVPRPAYEVPLTVTVTLAALPGGDTYSSAIWLAIVVGVVGVTSPEGEVVVVETDGDDEASATVSGTNGSLLPYPENTVVPGEAVVVVTADVLGGRGGTLDWLLAGEDIALMTNKTITTITAMASTVRRTCELLDMRRKKLPPVLFEPSDGKLPLSSVKSDAFCDICRSRLL